MIKMKERYEVLLRLEKSLEGTKMKPKGEIDVENGLLTYRGVPAIIVSRTTQGMLIREMYNLYLWTIEEKTILLLVVSVFFH